MKLNFTLSRTPFSSFARSFREIHFFYLRAASVSQSTSLQRAAFDRFDRSGYDPPVCQTQEVSVRDQEMFPSLSLSFLPPSPTLHVAPSALHQRLWQGAIGTTLMDSSVDLATTPRVQSLEWSKVATILHRIVAKFHPSDPLTRHAQKLEEFLWVNWSVLTNPSKLRIYRMFTQCLKRAYPSQVTAQEFIKQIVSHRISFCTSRQTNSNVL